MRPNTEIGWGIRVFWGGRPAEDGAKTQEIDGDCHDHTVPVLRCGSTALRAAMALLSLVTRWFKDLARARRHRRDVHKLAGLDRRMLADIGITGLAVDPGYPARPYVYVMYAYNHILGDPAPAPRWPSADAKTPGSP